MNAKRTVHGIDLTAPGGLEALFAFRRAQFGDAVMEQGAGEPPAETPEAPAPEPTPAPEAPAEQTPAPAEWDGKVESLPADAQKIIRDLRKADGDERIAAKQLAAIQKALNPDAADDEKPDPVKLAADLADRDTAARTAQTELAVYRAAGKHGADPDALLDSRAFLAKLGEIDPTDTAAVTKAVTDAITENPKLKATRAVGKSGTDFNGGPGETGKKVPLSLRDAVASHYSA